MGAELTPEILFGSNRERPCVRQIYGVSGQGKTVFLCESVRKAARSKAFGPKHRFIIFDVKHDGYDTLAPPVQTGEYANKKMDKDRVVVVHPAISDSMHDLNEIIDHLFNVARYDPEFSATLIIEESSTYIGTAASAIPDSIKRFATQGRSMGLSLILVNQRALSNKWTDTQSASVTCFRLAYPDREMMQKRWGIQSDEMDSKLSEQKFSFAHYDLEELNLNYYGAIKIPKNRRPIIEKRKKPSKITKTLRNPF